MLLSFLLLLLVTVCLLLLFLLSVLAAVCGHDNPTNVIVVVAAAVAAVAMNVFPLSPGCLVGFPGASLSVGSPWLARQSSVPRWFACKSHAVALSLLLFSLFFLFLLLLFFFFFFLSSFSSASLWWLPPSAAMTTPQRWMIRPTYTVIVVAVAFVAAAVAAVAMCFSTCAWLPGWVPWCVAADGSPAKVLLLRCLLSMLAAIRGHDNATKVDDMAHPLCYFLLLLLLLLLLLRLLRLLLVHTKTKTFLSAASLLPSLRFTASYRQVSAAVWTTTRSCEARRSRAATDSSHSIVSASRLP